MNWKVMLELCKNVFKSIKKSLKKLLEKIEVSKKHYSKKLKKI